MSNKKYSNFVRATSPSRSQPLPIPFIDGANARKLYLEEVKEVKDPIPTSDEGRPITYREKRTFKRHLDASSELSDKDLFVSAQNNDTDTLIYALDNNPDKINIVDEYGWSLLMIACQANSVEAVKVLLKRGIDTQVRDKAGNSARSLIINNKNLVLADIILNHKDHPAVKQEIKERLSENCKKNFKKVKLKEEYNCNICNNKFPDKQDHLSSTLHNINASKGKKIPATFKIPVSNKGYQLMLKDGWDRESGLGPDGSGNKYPIKAIEKKDRKGLGHKKNKESTQKETNKKEINKRMFMRDQHIERIMERDFRREFY